MIQEASSWVILAGLSLEGLDLLGTRVTICQSLPQNPKRFWLEGTLNLIPFQPHRQGHLPHTRPKENRKYSAAFKILPCFSLGFPLKIQTDPYMPIGDELSGQSSGLRAGGGGMGTLWEVRIWEVPCDSLCDKGVG